MLERLINGCAFDKRYKGQMLTFDRPRVFILANTKPDCGLLSRDRWLIIVAIVSNSSYY